VAAITTITSYKTYPTTIRTATAQANTGQTDWIAIPRWANYVVVFLNMSASAGTSPGPTLQHIKTVDPITRDDTNTVALLTATVGLTNTGLFVTEIGIGVKAGTDVTNSATRNILHAVIPPLLGVQTVLDRTNGDETYTYTLRYSCL
jgi:hypothetical protein